MRLEKLRAALKKCKYILFFYRSLNKIYYKIFRSIIKRKILKCKIKLANPADTPRFIVSLTSYGDRIWNTAPYTVYSLLNQNIQVDKIVLWLAENTVISPLLKKLMNNGLEIKFCEDIKSYKKLIPSLELFPDDVLITADDDVYYSKNWFKGFKDLYMKDKTKIYCHKAHEITFLENGTIAPYSLWKNNVKNSKNTERLFPIGSGGILYPPHSLDEKCLDKNKFIKTAPNGDDIWFWAMAKLHNTKCELTRVGRKNKTIDPEEEFRGLSVKNLQGGGNDIQINAVIKLYPEIIGKIQ